MSGDSMIKSTFHWEGGQKVFAHLSLHMTGMQFQRTEELIDHTPLTLVIVFRNKNNNISNLRLHINFGI